MNSRFSPVASMLWIFILGYLVNLTGCEWFDRDLRGQVFIVQKNGNSVKLGLVDIYAISEVDLRAHFLKKSQEGEALKGQIKAQYMISKSKIAEAEKAVLETKKMLAEVEALVDQGRRSGELNRDPIQALKVITVLQEMKTKLLPVIEAEAAKTTQAEQGVVNEYEGIDKPPYYLNSIPGLKAIGKTDADGKFSVRIPRGDMVIVAHGKRTVFDSSEEYHWAVKSDAVDLKKEVYLSNDNLMETRCPSCMLTSGK